MSAQETMNPGQVLGGRYRVLTAALPHDLGVGYKVYDADRDAQAVLLLLDPAFGSDEETVNRLTRLRHELLALDLPTLPPIEQIVVIDGRLALVRKRMVGRSLAYVERKLGRFSPRQAVETTLALCDTLAFAHEKGLVHGSLAPSSVWLQENGKVALTDTGLLPALPPVSEVRGQPLRRLGYCPPEQLEGRSVRPSADVYAIGALLYEMLTGQLPYPAGEAGASAPARQDRDPPALSEIAPNCPLPLAQIVHQALSSEPAHRYRNAGQMAHVLRAQMGLERARKAAFRPAVPTLPVSGAAAVRAEESSGVDWLLVGLLIAALFAVLGLIPLWHLVLERYTLPAPPVGTTLQGLGVLLTVLGRPAQYTMDAAFGGGRR